MSIYTVVTWKLGYAPSAEVQQLVDDEILRLKSTGVTINTPVKSGGVTTRSWDTREAAQNWIDFINLLEGASESAVIVEN
jgi:hypothetical protein